MAILERRILLYLIILFSALTLLELPGSFLFEPDEARYAEIPREMLATKDFVTPHLNGSVYLEKPPLLYWVNSISMAVFGENPYAARLPSRLAFLGVILILILGLKTPVIPECFNRESMDSCFRRNDGSGGNDEMQAGFWAALIFICNPLSMALSRLNLTDGLLTFSITLAFFCLKELLIPRAEEKNKSPVIWQIGLGGAMATAFLTKGLIGVVFPGITLIFWCAWFRSWRLFRDILLSWAGPVFFALVLPWFILVERANPGFLNFYFIYEHFQRFTTEAAKRPGPVYYFILTFLLGFLPWTFFFANAIKKGVVKLWRREAGPEAFFTFWFLFILLFFSVSKSKLIPYIFPIWPAAAALLGLEFSEKPELGRRASLSYAISLSLVFPVAFFFGLREQIFDRYSLLVQAVALAIVLVVGAWIGFLLDRRGRREAWMAAVISWLLAFGILISTIPALAADYSTTPFAAKLKHLGVQSLVGYKCYPVNLSFDLKKTIPTVSQRGELATLGPLDSNLFWDEISFWARWNSDDKMAAVVRTGDIGIFQENTLKPSFAIDRNPRYYLLANFPTD